MVDFGCDFDSNFELLTPGGRFKTVNNQKNAYQSVVNRLTTIPRDLDLLGYDDYGNYAYRYIASTNVNYAKALIKLATEEALIREPVVKEIIDIDVKYENKTCIVDVTLKLLDDTIMDEEIDLFNPQEEI